MEKGEIEAIAHCLKSAKIRADHAVANLRDDGPCCSMAVVLLIPRAHPSTYAKIAKMAGLDHFMMRHCPGASYSFCRAQGDVERVANLTAFTYLIDKAGDYEWTLEYMPD